MRRPDTLVLLVFIAVVLIAGSNFVAVRFSNRELAPFWGATLRFAIGAAVLLAAMALFRMPLPRGAALQAALVYGGLTYFASYALAYWALVTAPAAFGAVAISLSPLATVFLAAAFGLERLRPIAIGGAALAALGVALAFADRLGTGVPLAAVLALVAATGAGSLAQVIVKRLPRTDPIGTNAVGMAAGVVPLLALSLLAGEPRVLPQRPESLAAVLYLGLVASPLLFVGVLFVLQRWTASATSYLTVFMPLVTVVLGAVIAGERVGALFLVGTGVVLAGVYVGAMARPQAAAVQERAWTPAAGSAPPASASPSASSRDAGS